MTKSKTYLTALIFTLSILYIYVPAQAQGPSDITDPFTDYILNLDNPCEDELYLELKEIDLEEMTDRQFEIFKQKDQACQDYQNLLRSTEAENTVAESFQRSNNNVTKYLIFSGILTAASIIWLSTI